MLLILLVVGFMVSTISVSAQSSSIITSITTTLANFYTSASDLNGDNITNTIDLAILIKSISVTPTPTVPPPTPAPGHHKGEYPTIPTSVPAGQPTPIANQDCPTWVHDAYKTTGIDGKKYATWHPPVEPFWKCIFRHEHGSDPRKFIGYNASGMPYFGYPTAYSGIDQTHIKHEGYKVYVINNNAMGKAMLRSFHMGSYGPTRAVMRFHEIQVWYVAINNPNTILVRIHNMMDFGSTPNCTGGWLTNMHAPNRPTVKIAQMRNVPVFRNINLLCPNIGNDNGGDTVPGILHQNAYEQWQGGISIGDYYHGMVNYNMGNNSTIVDPNDLSRLVFTCTYLGGCGSNGSPAGPFAGTKRQFKYFGEIVNNTSGNPIVWANAFGDIVPAGTPNALQQYINTQGWNSFGRDGVRKDITHFDYYQRMGVKNAATDDYICEPRTENGSTFCWGDYWESNFDQGHARWPN